MTEAMPFLQKYDITFLRPPTIKRGVLRKKRGTAVCRPSKNSYLTAALRRAFESDVCFFSCYFAQNPAVFKLSRHILALSRFI